MKLTKQECREIADFLDLLHDLYKAKKNHSPAILAHIKRMEQKLEEGCLP
jgi:hypothetical protein